MIPGTLSSNWPFVALRLSTAIAPLYQLTGSIRMEGLAQRKGRPLPAKETV